MYIEYIWIHQRHCICCCQCLCLPCLFIHTVYIYTNTHKYMFYDENLFVLTGIRGDARILFSSHARSDRFAVWKKRRQYSLASARSHMCGVSQVVLYFFSVVIYIFITLHTLWNMNYWDNIYNDIMSPINSAILFSKPGWCPQIGRLPPQFWTTWVPRIYRQPTPLNFGSRSDNDSGAIFFGALKGQWFQAKSNWLWFWIQDFRAVADSVWSDFTLKSISSPWTWHLKILISQLPHFWNFSLHWKLEVGPAHFPAGWKTVTSGCPRWGGFFGERVWWKAKNFQTKMTHYIYIHI